MPRYKVIYELELGKQKVDLSTIIDFDRLLKTRSDIDEVIDKANTFINSNMHIPIDILNDAEIDVYPVP